MVDIQELRAPGKRVASDVHPTPPCRSTIESQDANFYREQSGEGEATYRDDMLRVR